MLFRTRIRAVVRWIEDLDRMDDDYFGYGNDNAIVLRCIARPIKQTVEYVTGLRFSSVEILVRPVQKRLNEELLETLRNETPELSNASTDPRQMTDFYYLPFALPDEVRVAHYRLDTQPETTSIPLRTQLASFPKPKETGRVPMIGPWTRRIAGIAVAIAIMHLFVVRPLTLKVESLKKSLAEQSALASASGPIAAKPDRARTVPAEAHQKAVIASADQAAESASPNVDAGSSESVPDPYQP